MAGDIMVWREIVQAREIRARAAQATAYEQIETWRASDWRAWLDLLDDCLTVVKERTHGDDQGDVRAAVLDLAAVPTAFIDALDARPGVG